jgi:hypothetical protein
MVGQPHRAPRVVPLEQLVLAQILIRGGWPPTIFHFFFIIYFIYTISLSFIFRNNYLFFQ